MRSPIIPPEIPPITGINPNRESLPISEKISFEETFSGSGINLFKKSLSSLDSSYKNFISLKLKTFSFALSKIFSVFLLILFLFCSIIYARHMSFPFFFSEKIL